MNEITVSAKTLDDAITEASIQLGITSDMIDYDVIEKGSTGFLGIGAKQAVIKARKKDETIQVKQVQKEEPKKEVVKKEEPKKEQTIKNIKEQETTQPVKAEEKEFTYTAKETKLDKISDVTVAECEKFLHDVLETMGMKVQITSKVDSDGALCMDMQGDNMGVLIGKRGQTLDSLQYLANRVANKMQDGYIRVKLDTENYRQRRKDTLESLAKNISYKVKRTKNSVSLEPMNPYERRIIHSALQGDKYITTHSEGEEPYRRVVIAPKK